MSSIFLGIDIGGSGIKGAPVDLTTGELTQSRLRIPTPEKSTPKNVGDVIGEIIDHFTPTVGDVPVGITFPAPVVHGVIPFIANLHQKWAGLNADEFLTERLGRNITLVNDADAAGLAEVRFGAAKNHQGVVIVTTLGTGIGSAIIHRGVLVPNSELGHLEIDGHEAEKRAASSIKDKEGLSYKDWTKRLHRYYSHVEMLFSPDLFVIGGGVSKDWDKFGPNLGIKTPTVPAVLRNQAGIIGAAMAAADAQIHPEDH